MSMLLPPKNKEKGQKPAKCDANRTSTKFQNANQEKKTTILFDVVNKD